MSAVLILSLSLATLCADQTCHPVLVGASTPVGEFTLTHYSVDVPGYGGDVLGFAVRNGRLLAVHRVLPSPSDHRAGRLSARTSMRKDVTDGCVNVSPDVYDELVRTYEGSTLKVVP